MGARGTWTNRDASTTLCGRVSNAALRPCGGLEATRSGVLGIPMLLAWASGTANGLNTNNVYKISTRLRDMGERVLAPGAEEAFLVSSLFIGGMIGVFAGAWVARRHGRVKALMFGECVVIMFGILQGMFLNVLMITIFRCFLGIGLGVCTLTKPMFVAEITPERSRGGVLAMFTLGWAFGMGVINLMDSLLGKDFEGAWRVLAIVPIWPAVTLLTAALAGKVPESPIWAHEQTEAEKSSQRSDRKAKCHEKEEEETAHLLLSLNKNKKSDDIDESRHLRAARGTLSDSSILKRGVFIGCVYGAACVGCTVALIISYQEDRVRCQGEMEKENDSSAWWTASLLAAQFCGAVAAVYLVPVLSRRAVIVRGGGAAVVTGLAAFAYSGAVGSSDELGRALVLLYAFLSVSCVLAPYFVLVGGELFHPRIRTQGVSLTLAFWYMLVVFADSFLCVKLNEKDDEGGGGSANELCSMRIGGLAVALVCIFALGLTLPETKGVPLKLMPTVWNTESLFWRSAADRSPMV